jgi:hypothetical protein
MARRIDLNFNIHLVHGQKDGVKLHTPSWYILKMPLG